VLFFYQGAGNEPDIPPKEPTPSREPAGKAATPQKQAQVQALGFVFHPGASMVDIAAGGAVATADVEAAPLSTDRVTLDDAAAAAAVVDVVLVPFMAIAMLLNASKDFAIVGFTANTIPFPQWTTGVFCLQYHQIGAVLLTVNEKVVAADAISIRFGWKLESIPPAILLQGLSNVD